MTNYCRFFQKNPTWFFAVNHAERKNNRQLIGKIHTLHAAFRYVILRKRLRDDAIVIMPDNLHAIWTLPPEDEEFSTRWNMLKGHFSRSLEKSERISESRKKRGERSIWQRRFWVHSITGQQDYNRHMNYIHWNPVKHGHIKQVIESPYSSLHQLVSEAIYPSNWGHAGEFDIDAGE